MGTKILRKRVSIYEGQKIFDIIYKTLYEHGDTQIFVANPILQQLRKGDNHVFTANISKSGHYAYNPDYMIGTGEIWYNYTKDNAFSDCLAKASFIQNCEGYQQLVQFEKNNEKDSKFKYTHYTVGINQILFIDPKEGMDLF